MVCVVGCCTASRLTLAGGPARQSRNVADEAITPGCPGIYVPLRVLCGLCGCPDAVEDLHDLRDFAVTE